MIKRPLALAVISFICGIIAVMLDINILIVLMAVIAGCAMAVVLYGKRGWSLSLIIVIFLILGVLRVNIADDCRRKTAARYDGRVETIKMTVTDFSDGNTAVAEFKDKGKTLKVYLKIENQTNLFPGDIIRGEFTLRKPFSSKTQISDFSTYLSSRGIYLYAFAEDVKITGRLNGNVKGFIYGVRRYVDKVGADNFEGDCRALFNAMVMGDKSLISDELMTSFQGAGLNHIAVVSGMHLSIMIALQMLFLNKLVGKRKIGSILSIIGAVFITLATGAGASVVRACIMCSIYQIARICYRENDSINSLCTASGIMCLFNPYVLFNAGFVLSVLSVLGIILYGEKITSLLVCFVPRKIGVAAALCIAAQLTVTPMVMHYFNILTPYALISNVLVFPFSTAIVVAGLGFAVLAKVPVISEITEFLVKLLADVIEYVSSAVSSVPGAILKTDGLDATFLVMWVFILVLIYIYPKKKDIMLHVGVITLAALIISICFSIAGKDDIYLSFVNYGASSATVAHLPGDKLLMVDSVDKWDVTAFTDNYRKPCFDYAILTSEEWEKLRETVSGGYVKNVILPEELYGPEEKAEILNEAKKYNLRVDFLKNGEFIFDSGTYIEYLPIEQISNEKRCVKIEYKGKSLVTLQGLENKDIEKLCSLNVKIPADYLKLPFVIVGEKTDVKTLTNGQIIQTEREFNIK